MNNGMKPRQINRVATPIQVDASGNNVKNNNQVNNGPTPNQQINRVATPIQVSNTNNTGVSQEKVNNTLNAIPPKKERPKQVKTKKVDTHDPTNALFVTILLIIFACLVAFLGLYIVPKYLDNRSRDYTYNDGEEITTTQVVNNQINTLKLSDNKYINVDSTFNVKEMFVLGLVGNGTNFDLYVNNKKISSCDYMLSTVGVVDDVLIIAIKNNAIRTTKLYAITKDGEIILDIYALDSGMVLNDDDFVVFNSISLVLLASRVVDNNLITENTFGLSTGLNLCSEELMSGKNITDI